MSKERETYLAITKKITYMPLVIGNKSIFWWFDKMGILKANSNSFLGKRIQKKGDPIFGFDLKQAIQDKRVIVKPKVNEGQNNQVIFKDLSSLKVNNVIWATGFKQIYPWLEILDIFQKNGQINHYRGVTNIEGLYFVGLPWQYRRGFSFTPRCRNGCPIYR